MTPPCRWPTGCETPATCTAVGACELDYITERTTMTSTDPTGQIHLTVVRGEDGGLLQGDHRRPVSSRIHIGRADQHILITDQLLDTMRAGQHHPDITYRPGPTPPIGDTLIIRGLDHTVVYEIGEQATTPGHRIARRTDGNHPVR